MFPCQNPVRAVIAGAVIGILALSGLSCGGGGDSAGMRTESTYGTSFETAIKVGSVGGERDILSRTVCHGDGFFRRVHVEVH